MAEAGYILMMLIVLILVIFLMAWLLQISYNGSIPHMARHARPIMYWHAMAFLFFLLIVGVILFSWSKALGRE